jgi:hypothetical protein
MVFSGKCNSYTVQCKVQVFPDVGSRGPLTYARSGDSTSKCRYNNDNIIIVKVSFRVLEGGCCSCSLLKKCTSPGHRSVPTFRNVSVSCLGSRIQRVFGFFFLAAPSWGPHV